MDISVLRELGFSEREIKVYIALLEIGKSTAGPIAVRARLPQTKVYETLGKLIGRGLVSYIVVSKTKHFQAESPKEIFSLIEEKKEKFKEILDELEMKQKFGKEGQTAVVHEGYKSLKILFNSIANQLTRRDYYYAFALKEAYKTGSAPDFFANIHKIIASKKIKDLAIASFDIKNEIKANYLDNPNIKLRFVKNSMPVGVVIVPGKVIQLSWGELPTAVEIDSIKIAEDYKKFFEDMWKHGKS
jgi:sugar-specific transcriptional regulator TrmB